MRDSFKLFDCIEGVRDLPLEYTFDDNETVDINLIDISRFLNRKMLKVPSVVNTKLTWLDPYMSLATNFDNFNEKTKANYTRLKDALLEEYNVLDNYNGIIESQMTDTFNKSDTLTFNNRVDTRTLNNSDTLTFNNRADTTSYNSSDTLSFNNRVDTHAIDSNNPMSTEVTHSGNVRTENNVRGYNTPQEELESSTNVINGYNNSPLKDTTIESGQETDSKAGSEVNAKSGQDTNTKTGSEVESHSGTIADSKTGNEVNAESGTITHAYEETKHGNLGVTTSQQMLESEIELRLKYQIKDIILNAFIDEYTYI